MAPVYLNVYDLTTHNAYTYWCGVGIFHAGEILALKTKLLPWPSPPHAGVVN